MAFVKSFVFAFVLLLGFICGAKSKLMEGGDIDLFSLNNLDLMDFLSVVTGNIKIGNHTINLPQDLPKLFGMQGNREQQYSKADRRSFQEDGRKLKIKINPFGFSKKEDGWGWENENKDGWGWGGDEKEKGSGLISVSNFFRLGCILFDLKEIKDSAANGLYVKYTPGWKGF